MHLVLDHGRSWRDRVAQFARLSRARRGDLKLPKISMVED